MTPSFSTVIFTKSHKESIILVIISNGYLILGYDDIQQHQNVVRDVNTA